MRINLTIVDPIGLIALYLLQKTHIFIALDQFPKEKKSDHAYQHL